MAVSQNTFSGIIQIVRAMQNRGRKELVQSVTMKDVTKAGIAEPTLSAGETAHVINLDGMTVEALVVVTSVPVGVNIDGGPAIEVGSVLVLFDTSFTSLTIDNLDATNPAKPEVWFATTQ